MAKFLHHEQCPRCVERGADRRGNNLGIWADGSGYCFSCGYYKHPSYRLKLLTQEKHNDEEKAVLPSDFQRDIPAEGWKWLLQYGLPYSYWQTHCGYTPKEDRLVFTVGKPTRFSIGRSLGMGASKWKVYGDKSSYVEVVSEQLSDGIVLVEDLISAHKVGQVTSCIPLFGTTISDKVIRKLVELKRPVSLWLDDDQYGLLSRKMGRLQSFLGVPVRYIRTDKDPKGYTILEIKEFLK